MLCRVRHAPQVQRPPPNKPSRPPPGRHGRAAGEATGDGRRACMCPRGRVRAGDTQTHVQEWAPRPASAFTQSRLRGVMLAPAHPPTLRRPSLGLEALGRPATATAARAFGRARRNDEHVRKHKATKEYHKRRCLGRCLGHELSQARDYRSAIGDQPRKRRLQLRIAHDCEPQVVHRAKWRARQQSEY